ncbi:dienelactone hydrolase [Paraburkholderia strydomiana]|nr:dienelactone hydrolase [Paraburkholderia strydomiana]
MVTLAFLFAWASSVLASVGMVELPTRSSSGPVTIFYPAAAEAKQHYRGTFQLDVALNAPPASGNQRLIVISHGSPASPWVNFELTRTLVSAGFTVALPEHYADNYKDDSEPGPPSWKRRPIEVSRAIDRVRDEPQFGHALDFTRVGMYGMSAGGHTALSLAGGRWSPSRLRKHCKQNIADDFHACAGLATSLTGGPLDKIKVTIVRFIDNRKFDDDAWYGHTDPRITAIVAGVPFAADFDPESLKQPRVALALVTARLDRWLVPRFHGDAVLAVCNSCEHLADLPDGGHGALLGPLPANMPQLTKTLIGDPLGFDRAAEVPRVNEAITSFFERKLDVRSK